MKSIPRLFVLNRVIAIVFTIGRVAAVPLATFVTANFVCAADSPNILVIVSDDQGYADAGFQGSKDIPTPQLDRLAQAGLRCTSGYVTHPYCSPSRAGLLTGRYQSRFGHERNPRYLPENHDEGLPLSETLFPEYLAKAGYVTGWIGKWHLGAAPEFHPEKRGFMETFGFIGGGHHYQNWKPGGAEYLVPILRNGRPEAVKEHLTLAFGHEAGAFVTRHKDQPWFLYLAFNAPHSPQEPTAERLARFAGIQNKGRRAYAAQISLMDDAIGETLNALRATGQEKRTIVFFFSDNGGPHGGEASNAPLRGWKNDLYEGGIHVPFLVSWPGHLPSGKDYSEMVSSLDVASTALAVAGIQTPTNKPLDGVNLLPYLAGDRMGVPHEKLFWRENIFVATALRAGDDKFIRIGAKPGELYNLKLDLGEKSNLAVLDAKKTARLQSEVDGWMKQMSKHLLFLGLRDIPEQSWPGEAGEEK